MTSDPLADQPSPSPDGRSARRSIAVVGGGVSGLTAAYLLSREHDVTLYEAEHRLGGHSDTHDVDGPDGPRAVDTGFIVHNDRTYPLLLRLFAELGVRTRPTEMSMSIRCEGCGLEYAGGRRLPGLFAQPRRLLDPRYVRMLLDVKRFQRLAGALLDSPADADEPETLGDFLQRHDFSSYFVHHYAVPVVACVWSAGHATALEYPARYLFSFLRHHGFLSVSGSPQWSTVEGGSRSYVRAVAERLADVRTSAAVTAVTRGPDGVRVKDATGASTTVDAVVLACHADTALALLTDPTDDETAVLGAFGYSVNETVLHADPSLLPRATGARASWNYRQDGCDDPADTAVVTYWMNKLQGLDGGDLLVTLNATERIDPDARIDTMTYTHPIYTPASVAAQGRLAGLATDRTVYAGAYHGWGFHEDGCRSGVAAAAALGVTW